MRRSIFPPLVALALALPTPVHAQTPAVETAETLFNRAKEHADRNEWLAACPLYAESLRADPQAGALLRLADCEEHIAALAQALAHWREAIEKLGGTGNEKFLAYATKRAEELDARVPRLSITLAPGAPAGARVLRGGEELSRAALGVPMPVDPGAIEIAVIAPGREERRFSVELAEKDRKEITVEPGSPVGPHLPPPVVPKPIAPEPSWGRKHQASIILMGIAVGAAGAGAVAGEVTKEDYFDLQKTCRPGPCMSAQIDRLYRERDATNGLFIATGVAAATSLGVFAIETWAKKPSIAVAASWAGARVVMRY